MFIEVLIIYFIYSRISGRKLKFAENIEIEYAYIILFGFLIQLLPLILMLFKQDGKIYNIYKYIHILGYFLMFLTVVYNNRLEGFKLISSGIFLNFLAIILNSAKMPVSPKALELAGLKKKLKLLETSNLLTHSLMDSSSRLKFLGDIIPLGNPYPFPKIISIGDLLIGIGLIIFMIRRSKYKKE